MSDRDNGEEVGQKRSWAGGGDYVSSKRARSSGGRTELRLLIRSSSAGAIIGKGGSNIRELREKFNASIQIPDSRTAERVVNTSAFGIDDVSKLCGRIVELVSSEHPERHSPEISLLVHQSQAGTIIGRGGSRIKDLRESTRTAIKIFPDCCPNSTDRVCEIRGEIGSIESCIKSVLEMLEEAPPKGPMQPYDPNLNEGFGYFGGEEDFGGGMGGGRFGNQRGRGRMRGSSSGGGGFEGRGRSRGGGSGGRGGGSGGRGGGGGGFDNRRGGGNFRGGGGGRGGGNFYGGGNDYNSDNYGDGGNSGGPPNNSRGGFGGGSNGGGPETTTKVTIPTNLAGSIIGKGGQRIRQIRADSGAQIKIDEPAPGSEDRIITIIGTQEQIQNAQFLLQQSVRMHSGEKYHY